MWAPGPAVAAAVGRPAARRLLTLGGRGGAARGRPRWFCVPAGPPGEQPLSRKRLALTALGVGAAAGCMGTWFEMSHGVVCIPVLTLPPLALSQQIAVGTTVFGVAARQVLAATLSAMEPDAQALDLDWLAQVVDVEAVGVLTATGTAAALAGSALAARLSPQHMRRLNGLFLIGVATFVQYRSFRVNAELEQEEAGEATEQTPAPLPAGQAPPPAGASEAARLVLLGAASGACLGLFGIGPAWMLAPVLTATAPPGQLGSKEASAPVASPGAAAAALRAAASGDPQPTFDPDVASDAAAAAAGMLGATGTDERTMRTCTLAMVLPSLAAAARHFALGHVASATTLAIPLATGAILGSAIGGPQLADVPCDEEFRTGLSILLFAHGLWSCYKGV
ncbi:unnamed protein product [Prorocentrum cordatum]|uniref:Uncharacterized protein n=1 Tax=Prorocentrum cordatum TaxID=2364126 RepID=A0ABN9WQE2_9DINO|nr:unnamed protein product [Polarella glacialis]